MPAAPLTGQALRWAELPPGGRPACSPRCTVRGIEAALVGGSVRDLRAARDRRRLGRRHLRAAGGGRRRSSRARSWENRFGTVTVPPARRLVEVTTYRARARTAISAARTRCAGAPRWPRTSRAATSRSTPSPGSRTDLATPATARWWTRTAGARDLERGVLRAVGDPGPAFRRGRAAASCGRCASPRGWACASIPPTEARHPSPTRRRRGVSGERVRDELLRMLRPAPPRTAVACCAMMEALGLLAVVLPEVAALRGVPQAKALPGDALDHSLRTVDALPADGPYLRLAGLLHDVGKATTLADGHFIGHETVGARDGGGVLRRLRFPRAEIARRIGTRYGTTCSPTSSNWTDAAVRRFIRRVGADPLDDLFALRRADDVASGVGEAGGAAERALVERIRRVGATHPAILAGRLAVDGDDVQAALGIGPSPAVGMLLAALLEARPRRPRPQRPRDAAGAGALARGGRLARQLSERCVGAPRWRSPWGSCPDGGSDGPLLQSAVPDPDGRGPPSRDDERAACPTPGASAHERQRDPCGPR